MGVLLGQTLPRERKLRTLIIKIQLKCWRGMNINYRKRNLQNFFFYGEDLA
jgi:hypothetical protein